MRMKKASELFRQVDPHLTVIDGGTRHYNKHRTHQLTNQDWEEATGAVCPSCKQETLRIIDGVCVQCYNDRRAKEEETLGEKKERRYYKEELRRGTISLAQMREGRLS